MIAWVALFRREYLEHRGAFLYAPAVLLGVLTLGVAAALLANNLRIPAEILAPTALKLYEIAFIGMGQGWWWYLLIVVFFYFADAFSADRRNNAMLFWKSMPVSDLAMLASKTIAGLLVLPAIIFGLLLLSGVILYAMTLLAVVRLPNLRLPDPVEVLSGSAGIAYFSLTWFVLGLLWFAPFFAWVGALSTVFRRWSIPLAFLVPIVASVLENAIFYGQIPEGGYIYRYLWARMQFGLPRDVWLAAVLGDAQVDAAGLTVLLIGTIDWLALAGGLVVAALFVFAAAQYRRRGVAG